MHIENEFTGLVSWDDADFLGSAHFLLLEEDRERLLALDAKNRFFSPSTRRVIGSDRIHIDLVIEQIDMQDIDFDQVVPHVGDTFSHYFYGRSPMVLNVSAQIIDTVHSIGKAEVMELYQWLFRLYRVARTGIAPVLSFVGCTVRGAMLGIEVSEAGTRQDVVSAQFAFLALDMRYKNEDNNEITQSDITGTWRATKPEEEEAPAPTIVGVAFDTPTDFA